MRRAGTSRQARGTTELVLADQRGFTLVEAVVAMILSLLLAVAVGAFVIVAIDQQNQIASRTTATRQAEAGLEVLVRDLREAMSQDGSGNSLPVTVSADAASATTSIAFDIPTPGSDTTPEAITWTCPDTTIKTNVGECTRTVGSGASEQQSIPIEGVQSVTFSPLSESGSAMTLPATDPGYIGITLSVQVISQLDRTHTHIVAGVDGSSSTPSTDPIVIQAGIDLRNFA
jgi:prepilin-type N-terminal cleavage/methylation domain-containing protein